MSDLISREDALKALDEMSYKSPHESATSVVRKKHFGEILEKFIMQQPSAQQWIPCSERLPEDGTYLCWEWQGFCYVDSFKDGNWGLAEKCYAKCIAWMPLPKPYKESKQWMI